MAASTGTERTVRLLGLGNDILADDALGILAAREAERRFGGMLDVVCSSAAGFYLMDALLGVSRLLVVDVVMTGKAKPGTVRVFSEQEVQTVPGGSPHFVGLFEVLAAARALNLPAPDEVVIIGVEASDCFTIGGSLQPDVEAAIPAVVDLVGSFLTKWLDGPKRT